MSLIQVRNLSFSYGGRPLLEDISFRIESGERIALVGRNGAGKSTLLRLLGGEVSPDDGDVVIAPGCRVSRLAQEVPAGTNRDVFEEVALGLGPVGTRVAEFRRLTRRAESSPDADTKARLVALGQTLDPAAAWEHHRQIEAVLSRTSLDPDARFDSLSSGMKRRVLLARSLVESPDVLLLDEPTNHLDIDAITSLEDFLLRAGITTVFVTHDRAFLQRLATRIIEIDRARLFDWTCDYRTFLQRKEAALEAEERQAALFDKKLAAEEAWIRQGIKARRTRNEGRVRALKRLREERRQRRERTGNVRMQVQEAARSGRLMAALESVTHAFGENVVLRDVSLAIDRGDKVGLVGPNGAGKTTLLRILLGQLTPSSGTVRLGTNLQVAYFDQLRAQLDENRSAADNVADGKDSVVVVVDGHSRHIVGYMQDFLFTPERARSLVKHLSGGERNRLLLARMFTRPANVLVLDEPTNDLDAETLQLLEELLVDYSGTVLLVSHDRAFLNHVVTSIVAFEGEGRVREYTGGYDDWLREREPPAPEPAPTRSPAKPAAENRPRKRSYREQQELDQLPPRIEQLESEQALLHASMADPAFYRQSPEEIARQSARLKELEQELATAYARWEELESL